MKHHKNKSMSTSKRVMVVEDSDFNQIIAESFLKAWGYTPVGFQRAADSLDELKGEIRVDSFGFDDARNGWL